MNRKERRAAAKSDSSAEANRLFTQAVTLHRDGRLKECVPVYRRLLALAPHIPEAQHNLGIALKGLGKLDEAITCYRRAIALAPHYADAHNSLGNALSDLGQWEQAAHSFQTAIELAPDQAAARNNLGTVLLEMGKLAEAEQEFRRAISLDGSYAEAHNNLGAALAAQAKTDEALAHYGQTLALDPTHPRAHANRAALLLKLGRAEDALPSALKAVELAPHVGLSQNTLGNVLQALSFLPQAAQAYEQAVGLQPDAPEFHDNLGNVLSQLGRSAEAEACCRQALKLDSNFFKAHNNLGTALKDQGKRREAELCFRTALDLSPQMPAAHTNLGMSLLYHGDFVQGWREFEWRWSSGKLPLPSFSQPRWVGEDLNGKTIVLTAEQGLGDSIQFARYGTVLAQMGATVILQVQPPLTRLLSTVPGVAQAVAVNDPLPPFDYHIPLLSLPLVLGTTLDTIPAVVPYVSSPDVRRPDASGYLVGLVWAGDPRPHDAAAHAADGRRSIPLTAFTPLLDRSGTRFFSLQMGEAKSQLELVPENLRPHDAMEQVTDFADTAALIAGLDLVITVDTSVAHLAGALGKPVWMLSRLDGCWRWMADREDSPWYPSMRLFRQTTSGQWHDVIERVGIALNNGL